MAISSSWTPSARSRSDDYDSLIWERGAHDVWAATGGRGLAGFVEVEGSRYVASSALGDPLGSFDTLSDAQTAVAAAEAAVRLLDDERLAPRSTATIALVTVVSAVAFASLVGAWLTSSL